MEHKKITKQTGSRIGAAILLYSLILTLVTRIWDYLETGNLPRIPFLSNGPSSEVSLVSALAMIAAVCCGLAFLFLFFWKQGLHKELFKHEKKMTLSRFAVLVCFIPFTNMLASPIITTIEAVLNLFGYSGMQVLTAVNEVSSATDLIYCCLVAPIVEELVYRGFALRGMEKLGKKLTILVTAVLFGLMHGNPLQCISAFFAGLLFGFVATEYSVIWSIILHIVNNLLFATILPLLTADFGQLVQLGTNLLVNLSTMTVCIVVLCRSRQAVGEWLRENKWEKPQLRWVLLSTGMILCIVGFLYENATAILPL